MAKNKKLWWWSQSLGVKYAGLRRLSMLKDLWTETQGDKILEVNNLGVKYILYKDMVSVGWVSLK